MGGVLGVLLVSMWVFGADAVELDIMGQPCPPRWSLPRGRNALCASHNGGRSVLSASITWFLAPHSAYREACSRKSRQRCRCVERVRGPHGLSILPLAACASFWRVSRLRIHS